MLNIQAEVILDEMIADIILTQTMAGHREIVRGRAICGTCGTKSVQQQ